MLLGTGALIIGLTQPTGSGARHGFFVTTVGITAIVAGVEAVRRARYGRRATRLFGRLGATLGGIGSVLMAYALVAFLVAPAGIELPSLAIHPGGAVWQSGSAASPLTADLGAVDEAAAASSTAPPSIAAPTSIAAPPREQSIPTTGGSGPMTTPWVPTDAAAEKSAVAQSAGTLAFVLKQRFGTSGTYPSTLVTGMDSPERIMLATGEGLAPVPNGAKVIYTTSSDRLSWSVTIVGASFGQVASYDSTEGVVRT